MVRRVRFKTERNRKNRLTRAKRLLNTSRGTRNAVFFFFSMKIIVKDKKANSKNNRCLCTTPPPPPNVPTVMHTKFPASVMVLEMSSKGEVMPPHLFDQAVRINSVAYTEILNIVVKPWITSVARERLYSFSAILCTIPYGSYNP